MTGICMKQWSALKKAGIKLYCDKCVIKTKCCSCFGNLYTPEGGQARPKESRCNQTYAATSEQTAAQLFLGHGNLFISIYAKHFFL